MSELHLKSLKSNESRLQPGDHEIDLQAVASNAVSINELGQGLTSDEKFLILKRLNYEGLTTLEDLPVAASFMIEKISSLSVEEGIEILKETIEAHESDINFENELLDLIKELVNTSHADIDAHNNISNLKNAAGISEKNIKCSSDSFSDPEPVNDEHVNFFTVFDREFQIKLEAGIIAYYSPYPEVRSVTDPYDDPSIPCETVRAYLVGLIWTAIGAFINQFFTERMPPIQFSTSVAQLFIYPSGILASYIIPDWTINIWSRKIQFSPGSWTFKEQMLSTLIFAIAGGSTTYITSNVVSQKSPLFYGNTWVTWGFQILLGLSTNFIGFGFAGLIRKFVVFPQANIWPSMLPTLALNRALMKQEKKEIINGWSISKYNFFLVVSAASFVYYWIPGYLFNALSIFNWLAWIKPDNYTLATITGMQTGLGINPLPTFDWTYINFNMALAYPFFSQASTFIGVILGTICIAGVYYTNYYWSGYLPILSNGLFDNTGNPYQVTSILNDAGKFDQSLYEKVGPPFYTAANLVVYGAFFAIYPFSIVWECMNNYKGYYFSFKQVIKAIKNWRSNGSMYDGFNDPHCRMMSRYKEVPEYFFLIVLLIALVFGIIVVEIYPTETPVWSIFFALGINIVFLIPLTTIQSMTGFAIGLNVLVELIIGYALPGNAQALMIIKAFGYTIDGQADNYISNLKMAHYARIPPRAVFRGQMLSVFLATFVGLAVVNWQLDNIKDFCDPHQNQHFTCANSRTFFSASVLWGAIGPKKVFSGLYPLLKYCFLIGAVAPFILFPFKYYFPRKLKYFHPTVIIGGFLNLAPYNFSYFVTGFYVSLYFMWYLRKYFLTWWEKYNYLLGAALTAGLAFSNIILFFAVQYHPKVLSWWGNDVNDNGYDAMGVSRLNATISAPDGYFGPRIGHFP